MVESYAYIPLEEQTRNKLKVLKRELSYDAFINMILDYIKTEKS